MAVLNYITWDVSDEIFRFTLPIFGSVALRWYGLLFALGFVFGQIILTRIYKAEGVREKWVDVITLYMIVGTVLGARLGHCLFYEPEVYLKDPIRILKIWEGGLASHGATVGILLALYLFARKYKFDYLWVLDRIVIVVALGGALIRLGNLFNSEIVGKATDVPWAFIFMRNFEFPQVPRHPAQLYESISSFLLFLALLLLWSRLKAATPRGRIFGLFVVILFTLRFLYEFLKEAQVDFEETMTLNMGQILSIPLILVGLWVLIRSYTHPVVPVIDPFDPEESKVKVKR
ncbi:prolipoprotein diacylglyceryl transferase [Adhaeribacter rhizoryzae]|uniref:Phosphatidylglycerol--prolipoprotein diacylglyceryl transferase n=1 Tax=Adhaeribacter rhizoryzae TaxID=2607907 RepID=A0A5M6DK24_9BACT|nr:prolipoprotein diacylglyceryl transferase [Adhaeribacter rhizoryzae]KAA5546726.1 prolipoprotein diacylglyceryl transferase [Adhaeribacter rhizoryzae]